MSRSSCSSGGKLQNRSFEKKSMSMVPVAQNFIQLLATMAGFVSKTNQVQMIQNCHVLKSKTMMIKFMMRCMLIATSP